MRLQAPSPELSSFFLSPQPRVFCENELTEIIYVTVKFSCPFPISPFDTEVSFICIDRNGSGHILIIGWMVSAALLFALDTYALVHIS